jgi:hypothetical protein
MSADTGDARNPTARAPAIPAASVCVFLMMTSLES